MGKKSKKGTSRAGTKAHAKAGEGHTPHHVRHAKKAVVATTTGDAPSTAASDKRADTSMDAKLEEYKRQAALRRQRSKALKEARNSNTTTAEAKPTEAAAVSPDITPATSTDSSEQVIQAVPSTDSEEKAQVPKSSSDDKDQPVVIVADNGATEATKADLDQILTDSAHEKKGDAEKSADGKDAEPNVTSSVGDSEPPAPQQQQSTPLGKLAEYKRQTELKRNRLQQVRSARDLSVDEEEECSQPSLLDTSAESSKLEDESTSFGSPKQDGISGSPSFDGPELLLPRPESTESDAVEIQASADTSLLVNEIDPISVEEMDHGNDEQEKSMEQAEGEHDEEIDRLLVQKMSRDIADANASKHTQDSNEILRSLAVEDTGTANTSQGTVPEIRETRSSDTDDEVLDFLLSPAASPVASRKEMISTSRENEAVEEKKTAASGEDEAARSLPKVDSSLLREMDVGTDNGLLTEQEETLPANKDDNESSGESFVKKRAKELEKNAKQDDKSAPVKKPAESSGDKVSALKADVERLTSDKTSLKEDVAKLQETEKRLLSRLDSSQNEVMLLQSDAALLSDVQEITYNVMKDLLIAQHEESETLRKKVESLERKRRRTSAAIKACTVVVSVVALLAVVGAAVSYFDSATVDVAQSQTVVPPEVAEAATRAIEVVAEDEVVPTESVVVEQQKPTFLERVDSVVASALQTLME